MKKNRIATLAVAGLFATSSILAFADDAAAPAVTEGAKKEEKHSCKGKAACKGKKKGSKKDKASCKGKGGCGGEGSCGGKAEPAKAGEAKKDDGHGH
jgi:hypothetical protein